MDWTDGAFLLGLALIVAGVGWVFPPAGLIVAGAFLACLVWLLTRGGDDE